MMPVQGLSGSAGRSWDLAISTLADEVILLLLLLLLLPLLPLLRKPAKARCGTRKETKVSVL